MASKWSGHGELLCHEGARFWSSWLIIQRWILFLLHFFILTLGSVTWVRQDCSASVQKSTWEKKKNTASPWNIFHNNGLGLVTVIRWMLPQFMHGESKAKRVKITDVRWDRWEFWNSEQQIVINIDGRFPGVPALPRMSTSHSFIMVVNLHIFNSIWTLPLYGPYGWMSGLSASLYSPQCPRLRHKHLEHSFLNRKVFLHQGVKSLWGLPSPWP